MFVEDREVLKGECMTDSIVMALYLALMIMAESWKHRLVILLIALTSLWFRECIK